MFGSEKNSLVFVYKAIKSMRIFHASQVYLFSFVSQTNAISGQCNVQWSSLSIQYVDVNVLFYVSLKE